MLRIIGFMGFLSLAVVSMSPASAQTPDLPTEDEADITIQPEAIKALDRMAGHLRTLSQFRLNADFTVDEVTSDGQKIQSSGRSTYSIRTPDRLRLDLNSDKQSRVYLYDGKTVTQYAPGLDIYSVFGAPANIADMIDAADAKYGVQLPLADLFFWGTERSNVKELKSAVFVGETQIRGDSCSHFAYRAPEADIQVWIRSSGDPLPCRLIVTSTVDEARPEYEATLEWELAPVLGEGMFSFVPPPGVTQIDQEPVQDEKQGG